MTKMTIITDKAAYPGNLADEYLELKGRIADLKVVEDKLRNAILETGETALEGRYGRVTVSETDDREVVDYRAAAEALIPEAKLAEFKKTVSGSVRFNVRARRG